MFGRDLSPHQTTRILDLGNLGWFQGRLQDFLATESNPVFRGFTGFNRNLEISANMPNDALGTTELN
jgi:hypothetical protein